MNYTYVELNEGDLRAEKLRQGFIEFYIDVFSGLPFEEFFSFEEVDEIYTEALQKEAYFCCVMDQKVMVAFCIGKPLSWCGGEMLEICSEHVDVSRSFYNSDVGTHPDHRKKGIASSLIDRREKFAQSNQYKSVVMRTNVEGSMSAPLYRDRDYKQMRRTMWVEQPRVNPNIPSRDERLFLWRELEI